MGNEPPGMAMSDAKYWREGDEEEAIVEQFINFCANKCKLRKICAQKENEERCYECYKK